MNPADGFAVNGSSMFEQDWPWRRWPWLLHFVAFRSSVGPVVHERKCHVLVDSLNLFKAQVSEGVQLGDPVTGTKGGHARVGFENNLSLPDGARAASNAELVGAAARAFQAVGLQTQTADSLREEIAAAMGK